ncbi:ribonuclease-3 [Aequitasia blattaphilus]|uniref:Ribonuclease 3 n=1 Tax=Aequitasia blattaphilus TaxID=2949332 RepID=A0ABT1E9J6_9FIRM|nr:ribonuclease III [Aequitasia blattaphilus]MCP1101657.1 ribonuclease III [Aequitasia blattaphilus]MCR8614297.1 ribonuclease III [Aequitasia blattaphilus]
MEKDYQKLMEEIKYRFHDEKLLLNALRHSSYINEHNLPKEDSNERLEFLGDAVLELISSEFLFYEHPGMAEGNLTKQRASMVCEPALAYSARKINLGDYLYLGKGEDNTGGRKRDSVTSDAFEALIGAIYLDGGLASAKEFIHQFVLDDAEKKKLFYDSKTILQELIQSNYKDPIEYILLGEEGPDHDKSFYAQVKVGKQTFGKGKGRTKKAAEQEAAYHTILSLNKKIKR